MSAHNSDSEGSTDIKDWALVNDQGEVDTSDDGSSHSSAEFVRLEDGAASFHHRARSTSQDLQPQDEHDSHSSTPELLSPSDNESVEVSSPIEELTRSMSSDLQLNDLPNIPGSANDLNLSQGNDLDLEQSNDLDLEQGNDFDLRQSDESDESSVEMLNADNGQPEGQYDFEGHDAYKGQAKIPEGHGVDNIEESDASSLEMVNTEPESSDHSQPEDEDLDLAEGQQLYQGQAEVTKVKEEHKEIQDVSVAGSSASAACDSDDLEVEGKHGHLDETEQHQGERMEDPEHDGKTSASQENRLHERSTEEIQDTVIAKMKAYLKHFSDSDSDSDFVRLDAGMMDDEILGAVGGLELPGAVGGIELPLMSGSSGSSSLASSVSSNFRFIHPFPLLPAQLPLDPDNDEEDNETIPEEVDDRCESDISGVAGDTSDLSAMVYQIGDAPLTADDVPRSYCHQPNERLDAVLTTIALLALFLALGIGIGHYIGTTREATLRKQYINRMKELQDDYLMCLRDQSILQNNIKKQPPMEEKFGFLMAAWQEKYQELLVEKASLEAKVSDLERHLLNDQGRPEESYHLESVRAMLEKSREPAAAEAISIEDEEDMVELEGHIAAVETLEQELKQRLQDSEQRLQEYVKLQAQATETIHALHTRLYQVDEEKQELSQDVGQLQAEHAHLQVLHSQLDRQKSQLEARASQLQIENHQLVTKTSQLQETLSQLDKDKYQLEETVSQLDKSKSHLQMINSQLEGQLREEQQQVEELKSQLVTREWQPQMEDHKPQTEDESPAADKKSLIIEAITGNTVPVASAEGLMNAEEQSPIKTEELAEIATDVIASQQPDAKSEDMITGELYSAIEELKNELNQVEQEKEELLTMMGKLRYSEHPGNTHSMSEQHKLRVQVNQLLSENLDLKHAVGKMRYSPPVLHHEATMEKEADAASTQSELEDLRQKLWETKRSLEKEHNLANLWQTLYVAEKVANENRSTSLMTCLGLLLPQVSPVTLLANASQALRLQWQFLTNITQDKAWMEHLEKYWLELQQLVGHVSEDMLHMPEQALAVYTRLQQSLADKWQDFLQANATKVWFDTPGMLFDDVAGTVNNATQSEPFKRYVETAQDTVRQLSDTLQHTWEKVRNLSTEFLKKHEDTIRHVKDKVKTKVSNIGRKVENKMEEVKRTLQKHGVFGGTKKTSKTNEKMCPKFKKSKKEKGPKSENLHYEKTSEGQKKGKFEDKPSHKQKQSDHETYKQYEEYWQHTGFEPDDILEEGFFQGNNREWRKHQKTVRKLHGRIHKLNEDIITSMDDDDIEDIYDDLEDLQDDLDDSEQPQRLKTWLTCQIRWWKSRFQRKKRNEDMIRGCGKQLMHWQMRVICKDLCGKRMCKGQTKRSGPICSAILNPNPQSFHNKHSKTIANTEITVEEKPINVFENEKKEPVVESDKNISNDERKEIWEDLPSVQENATFAYEDNHVNWYLSRMHAREDMKGSSQWYLDRMEKREDGRHDPMWYIRAMHERSQDTSHNKDFTTNTNDGDEKRKKKPRHGGYHWEQHIREHMDPHGRHTAHHHYRYKKHPRVPYCDEL